LFLEDINIIGAILFVLRLGWYWRVWMTKSNAIVGRRITSPCAAAIEGVSVLNIVSHHLVAVLFLHK
jgi:hypothetical protein